IQNEITLGVDYIFLTAKYKVQKSLGVISSSYDPLKELNEQTKTCQKCEIAIERTNLVFGSGNPRAKLVFVGEAPGKDEDSAGEPFVGKAGQLLNKMIKAIDLEREDVYIANVLKCRPPENRVPKKNEIINCRPYLLKQIETIKPKIICTLGTFAAQSLLNTRDSISRIRGTVYKFKNIKLIPIFHPAYLLRNPNFKKDAWDDLQIIKMELENEI
ncbi:MAG: uracil-DNA glycosylase, partial [Thermodesulfobacteriota bacterium]|nr:uracil-DNA glycosylase [Thermodesulfobacteriota bacterium]